MWKLTILFVIILVLAVTVSPVYAFDPPGQDTTTNATDTIIWHGDTANISVTHDSDLTITGLTDSINDFTNTVTGFFYLVPLLAISILAFWKENPFLFMLAFGIAWLTGLNAPDILSGNYETTTLGLTLGLMLIGYGLFCVVMCFRLMFYEDKG